MFLIVIYVDDILLAGKSMKRMNTVKQALSQKFLVKDMGELNYFLGVKVVQDHSAESIWIGQQSYTENILRQFEENLVCKMPRKFELLWTAVLSW